MRHFVAAMAVVALTGAASAQYKTPAPAGTPAIPVTANPNVQITPGAPDPSLDSARRVTREEAIKMVAAKKAVYVDVRAKDQYDIEHIKGAINIPLSEIVTRMKDLPKNKFIITYCAWQNEHTSARAVLDLNAKGMKDVAALLGGWNGWREAKLPIESNLKTPVKK